VEGEVYQLTKFFAQTKDYSFPSYHTAGVFVLALVVLFDWRKFGIILLVPAIIVGIARVFAGVHYPSDILGGILTALISVFFINYLLSKFIFNKIKIN
jgi:undecaprenyl-diphosphatase